jgi:hypothetical protein
LLTPARLEPHSTRLVRCRACACRANNAAVKLAGLRAAVAVMCAPTPAIAAPPSAASPEVKALASREEAAMVALSRCAAGHALAHKLHR